MRWERYLRNIYRDLKRGGSFQSAEKLYHTVKREGKYEIPLRTIEKFLEGQDTYTLNKEVRRKFETNAIPTIAKNKVWEADLADLAKFMKHNDNYRYLLGCFDSFSRKLYVRPLKSKKGTEIVKALKEIFQEAGTIPRTIRSDRGSEFTNSVVTEFLKEEGVGHSFTSNLSQAAFIERCWKSLKKRMVKYMQDRNTKAYIGVLQDLVKGYNNTFHSAIGMTPNEVKTETHARAAYNMIRNKERRRPKKKVQTEGKGGQRNIAEMLKHPPKLGVFKFDIGTKVRISLRPSNLVSEYAERWSKEIFTVQARKFRNGIQVYKVVDDEGEVLVGSFYAQELQRVTEPKKDKLYDVKEILKERTVTDSKGKKKKEYLVSFVGFPRKFNQWIPQSDVKTKKLN